MQTANPKPLPAGIRKYRFSALGTPCTIQVCGCPAGEADAFACAAADRVRAREARWSRFREDSLVSRINRSAGDGTWHDLAPEDCALLDHCADAHERSSGRLDAAILPLVRLWEPGVPTAEQLAAARACSGWAHLERDGARARLRVRGAGLDMGGIGKELLVDEVAAMAQAASIPNYLVDFGGDIFAYGNPPGRAGWMIAVPDPRPGMDGKPRATLCIAAGGVSTSGDGPRSRLHGGRRVSHIIDPLSGEPSTSDVIQATVIGSTCLEAGLLTTLACLLPSGGAQALLRAAGRRGYVFTSTEFFCIA